MRLALIAVAAICAGCAAAPERTQPVEAVFNQRCVTCHDNTLTGEGGGMAMAPTVESISLMPRARVRAALEPGSAHTYTDRLPRGVREALVDFLVPDDGIPGDGR